MFSSIVTQENLDVAVKYLLPVSSFLVSVYALVCSRRANRRSARLQEEYNAIEKAREDDRVEERDSAYLTAKIATREALQNNGVRIERDNLIIENSGKGEARNIKVLVNGKSVFKCAWCLENSVIDDGVIEVIGAGANRSFLISIGDNTPPAERPPFKVHLEWDDQTAKGEIWESEVNFD